MKKHAKNKIVDLSGVDQQKLGLSRLEQVELAVNRLKQFKSKFVSELEQVEAGAGDVESLWKIEKLRSETYEQHSIKSAFSCAKALDAFKSKVRYTLSFYNPRKRRLHICDTIPRYPRRESGPLVGVISSWKGHAFLLERNPGSAATVIHAANQEPVVAGWDSQEIFIPLCQRPRAQRPLNRDQRGIHSLGFARKWKQSIGVKLKRVLSIGLGLVVEVRNQRVNLRSRVSPILRTRVRVSRTFPASKGQCIVAELQKLVSEWPLEVVMHQKREDKKRSEVVG
ncbi:hypothetical protein Cgig2_029775 [Carnegiea gigantea]|uniref:Uncharacterized protein n=1 Tax=Carnegiea gigantea TaxID=171969 RepID=A0A9Q1K184_9CARY|nr:hypothetical protein Cgig2_029775 [Carnegiea gigantea]